MLEGIRRRWWRRRLIDPAFAFLGEPPPDGEFVSLDTETTSLDARKAEILAIAAIRIRGDRILASERLEMIVRPSEHAGEGGILIHRLRPIDVARGLPPDEAIDRLLHFIGPRTLVGYYLEYDLAILNRYLRPKLGVPLPNRRIEVSALYYDAKIRRTPNSNVDLSFRAIRQDLDLPARAEHDAFNDALLTAMMFLRLTGPGGGRAGAGVG
ncbi:MAG TPA: 3'-5' exonuclease [Geminicoccaceae bacterium]